MYSNVSIYDPSWLKRPQTRSSGSAKQDERDQGAMISFLIYLSSPSYTQRVILFLYFIIYDEVYICLKLPDIPQ